ncbi:MAG TPA: aminodeoxychorismate lyase [Steroidobacter sp.]|nr:aminodeoxychorismate lyase [Steroidobacteraceae bacterium]HLS81806.1 aminodeoxychorismate lyase [Steroidobacter sp.]
MTIAALIDGQAPQDLRRAIALNDRGFNYGDGVFETATVRDGQVRFLDAHLRRLAAGCQRLGMPGPNEDTLRAEIQQTCASLRSAVLKIVVTRGIGERRGYRPDAEPHPTRIVAVYPAPEAIKPEAALRWCDTRLGRNPQLAGVKHLNRLEQVLAQSEWRDPAIDEGLMLDTEGELVCATASNVFIVRDGVLLTPDLRFCGVRGVMREQVLRAAQQAGLAASEEPLWPHDLECASEVFITSAVRGVQPATSLGEIRWPSGPVASHLTKMLGL